MVYLNTANLYLSRFNMVIYKIEMDDSLKYEHIR